MISFQCSIIFAVARHPRNAFSVKQNSSTVYIIKSNERPTRNESLQSQRPLFASGKNRNLPLEPKLYRCTNRNTWECANKTETFRNKILHEFEVSLNDYLVEKNTNYYNVQYANANAMSSQKYQSVCMLLNAQVRVLTKNDSPFDGNKIGSLFPQRRLFGHRFAASPKTCVIVSSAGSLYQSGLGRFIGNAKSLFNYKLYILSVLHKIILFLSLTKIPFNLSLSHSVWSFAHHTMLCSGD